MSIRVRFNLGRGPNYKKWKVEFSKGQVEYFDPGQTSLIMQGCRLQNRQGSAQLIFSGRAKFVCAWIECDAISISEPVRPIGQIVRYNPKIKPYWTLNEINSDGAQFDELTTADKKVYITR
jgi:hypothetical protein